MEVSEIVEAVDMMEYLSQYCEFEEKGGEFWALSPFKDERTPSFSVNPDKGFFYDFSSGIGGNLLDFVMKYHKVSLGQAVRMLKQYAGIKDDGTDAVSQRLAAVKIAKKFRYSPKPRKQNLAKPLPDNVMAKYEFRRDKLKLWFDEGISWEAMRHFGVMYDAFANRIVYPVRDLDGEIISICGRTCDPDFKAKRIRKYTYYQEIGTVETLYGYSENLEEIVNKEEIILFEGAKSVMMAWGWGIRNTAALLTSHLSDNLFRDLVRLSSYWNVRIVFALDSDVNILEDENIVRLKSYARVEWVKNRDNLLAPKDSPTDKGEEIFRKLYQERGRVH